MPRTQRQNERRRERYAEDTEFRARERARHRAYYQAHKQDGSDRCRKLKCLYGMTQAEYDALLAKQGGACAICGRRPKGKLYVDHCHRTGRVRGLLCRDCNFALGQFRDDHRTLVAALAYLASRATDGPGAAAQRALLARAALPPGAGGRAVLAEVHLPGRPVAPLLDARGRHR